jgi:predicted DNA-binding protein
MNASPSSYKSATSYRLSIEALDMIDTLHKRLGISRASIIEMAVRKLAESEYRLTTAIVSAIVPAKKVGR